MRKQQISPHVFGRKALHSVQSSIPLLEKWFDTPLGQKLLEEQRKLVDQLVSPMFGCHALQLSMLRSTNLLEHASIGHCFSMGPIDGKGIAGLCDDERIPLESESVDLTVIHHVTEYSQNPHQLLRELSRITRASGHVIIIGFNPISLLGLRAFYGRYSGEEVWHNTPLTARRLADWLALMDFTVTDIKFGFYPPLSHLLTKMALFKRSNNKAEHHQHWPFGGFHVVVAKKEVAPYTPTRDYLEYLKKSMIPIMEPSLYTPPDKHSKLQQKARS